MLNVRQDPRRLILDNRDALSVKREHMQMQTRLCHADLAGQDILPFPRHAALPALKASLVILSAHLTSTTARFAAKVSTAKKELVFKGHVIRNFMETILDLVLSIARDLVLQDMHVSLKQYNLSLVQ